MLRDKPPARLLRQSRRYARQPGCGRRPPDGTPNRTICVRPRAGPNGPTDARNCRIADVRGRSGQGRADPVAVAVGASAGRDVVDAAGGLPPIDPAPRLEWAGGAAVGGPTTPDLLRS